MATVRLPQIRIPATPDRLTAFTAGSRSPLLAFASLAGANILWGGSPAASLAALDAFGPFTIGAARAGIALAVLMTVLAIRGERPATGRLPALLGLCGVALFCAFQNVGLLFADATTTTLIAGTRPVLIALLAVPLLHERLDGRRLAGLGLSVGGIGAIVVLGAADAPAASAAALLPLASALVFAVYAVLSRRGEAGASSIATITGATRYGLLFLLPGALLELASGPAPRPVASDLLLLGYLGVGCSALAFVLVGFALARLDAGRAAAWFNVQVLAGVALSATVLDEPLTLPRVAGGVLVVAGVAIASRTPSTRLSRAAPRNRSARVSRRRCAPLHAGAPPRW